jgi:hypothetical protein
MQQRGSWRVPDKYELLADVIKRQTDNYNDDLGWHHLTIGVLRDPHDHANGEIPTDELSEAIYDRISHMEGIDFDDELKPGEYDPETGEYNPGTDSDEVKKPDTGIA